MSLARPSPAIAPGTGIVPRSAGATLRMDGYGLSPKDLDALARFNPSFFAEYMAREEYKIRAEEKARYEGSLIEFIRRAWQEIESRPFEENWHHRVIADHLTRVAYGEIRNLIINIPPRHTKTLFVNVFFPAWLWCRSQILPLSGPQVSFLCVSYGATLSEEIAVKMRRLVEGDWYQSLWGATTKLLDDQRNRANFANVSGGERMSSSIEGGILGRGALIQILDDVQTRRGADSAVERASSLQGMSDLSTRITDPRISAKILIMQRLHIQDATDWALKNWPNDTVHLMFPARYEADRACSFDERTYDGELLWPDVWSEEELTRIEAGLAALDGDVLSDYAFAGQFQQNPRPRAGGIVNKDDWKVWPEWTPRVDDVRRTPSGSMFIPLPEVSRVILCLDTALSEKETADWNACVVLGVWHRSNDLVKIVGHEAKIDDGEQPRVIVMGAWRRRCKLNDETLGRDGKPQGLVQRVIDTGRRFNVDEVIIEDATRGKDVKNEIERQLSDLPFRIRLFNPKKHGDKTARLNSVQPLFSQGLVYMPGNCRVARDRSGAEYVVVDEFAWSQEIMSEVEAVPRGAHDDYADCCLAAGTLIATRRGDIPVERVVAGDEVVTPVGWRRVRKAGCVRIAEVIEAVGLRGTADHPVFTLERGYTRLDTVSVGLTASRLSLCGLIRLILQRPSSSTASPIAAWVASGSTTCRSPRQMREDGRRRAFMSPSGNFITVARSLLAMRSTTRIATRLILSLTTWIAYRKTCIAADLKSSIPRRLRQLWQRLAMRQRNGTLQTPDGRGIANMPPRLWRRLARLGGDYLPASPAFANGAGRSFLLVNGRPDSVVPPAEGRIPNIIAGFVERFIPTTPRTTQIAQHRWSARSAEPSIKPQSGHAAYAITALQPAGTSDTETASSNTVMAVEPVYNLAVEEAECYYANGILVHNCSMGLLSLREDGYLALTSEYVAAQMAARMHRGKRTIIRDSYGV